jgi:hypothetical protein
METVGSATWTLTNRGEVIRDVKHVRREVVDGAVVITEDLECSPECDPEKGIHLIAVDA